jgi:5-methylcytosine-specific restriction endonuclease McrA
MPYAAPHVCGYCGLTHLSGERCKLVATRDAARKARYDASRPNASQRGYGSDWRQAKALFLAQHPTCAMCGDLATVVDHIVRVKVAPDRRLDPTNWQPLCAHCHNSRKQRLERKEQPKCLF